MKRISILLLVVVISLVAAPRLAAQQLSQKPPHYTLTDLGTLGGTFSQAYRLGNSGWVGGYATLPGDFYEHAFLWRNGVMSDLGTLGGLNSFSLGGTVNGRGNTVGAAESSVTDPLDENWCGFNDGLECLPFSWRNDIQQMIALPTLGGHNGLATGINEQDEVSGQVENATIDSTCTGTFLEVKPVIWTEGKAHELPTFPGDPDGVAWAINDWGQAAGNSENCTASLVHMLLWLNGKAIYLGGLGGKMNNYVFGINNEGQVVGESDLPGDITFHAFLWQKGVMKDLGTLSGDVASAADGINIEGQTVGGSYDASGNERAVLWQNGVITDLNTLIPSGSGWFLVEADSINDEGLIVGGGVTSSGEFHAFLAAPSYGNAESESATMATSTERPKVNLPENVRKLLQRRARFGGLKGGTVTPQ